MLRHCRARVALLWLCLGGLLQSLQIAAATLPQQAAVATAHPLATRVGARILQQGGNAFDAAVGVSAALAVVEPYGSGLGGGGFYLLRKASAQEPADYLFLDAREQAPRGVTAAHYAAPRASLDGPLAAGIPGIPAALAELARQHGRLPLQTSLQPAIRLAREGFAVDSTYRQRAGWRLQALRRDPESARLFLVDDRLPPLGHRLRQPELAATLQRLARLGPEDFYHGQLARKLVEGVRAAGGLWTLEDLASYRLAYRPPIRQPLSGGRTLISAPPPSAGGIILAQSLGMLERRGLQQLARGPRMALIIEALRRAYRDRVHLGDPDFVTPPPHLLAPAYLDRLAAGIDLQHPTPSRDLPPALAWHEGSDTTHFTVLDTQGNAVSATLSLNMMFGAAFTVPGTGILLNDEMDDFAIDPQGSNAYGLQGSPANRLQPGKRPLSSMSPTFIDSPDSLSSFGTPGGSRIPSMVLLAILAEQQGAPVSDWVARPRFHHQYKPDVVEYEQDRLPVAQHQWLRQHGYPLKAMQRAYGNLQVFRWQKGSGRVEAASDPRGSGQAQLVTRPPQD